MANEYRLTAFYLETLNDTPAGLRVTSYPIETLHSGDPNTPMRVSAYPLEVLHSGQDNLSFARISSYAVEVLCSIILAGGGGRGAQIIG
jgi:hypothetical protein